MLFINQVSGSVFVLLMSLDCSLLSVDLAGFLVISEDFKYLLFFFEISIDFLRFLRMSQFFFLEL